MGNGELCSGPDHGECVCGKCKCNSECGECKCEETEEGQYSGKYCEDCPTCPGKCEELKACVQCQVFGSGQLMGEKDENGVDKCSLCPFKPEIVEKAEEEVKNDERLCTFIDDDDCRRNKNEKHSRERENKKKLKK